MNKKSFLVLTGIAVFIAVVLSPFASGYPDGLESVASGQEFIEKGKAVFSGIIPDYAFPFFENSFWQTAVAGGIGILLMLFFMKRLGGILFRVKG